MTSTEDTTLTDEEVARMEGREVGTSFDWVGWPPNVYLDGNVATEYPDRAWAKSVDDMLKRDGQAEAVMTALTMPIRMANWTIEKPADDPKNATEWIRAVLTRHRVDGGMTTPFNQVIGQMTQARAFKRSYHEKVWMRDKEGKATYQKIAWRPPVTCLLQRDRENGEILGFKQWQDPELATKVTDAEGYVVIPKERAVVYVHGTHRDPLYGKSDMDVVLWAYELKQKVLKWWATFCDRQGIPKVIVFGKDPNAAAANARAIAKLGSAGIAAVTKTNPDDKVFEVLDNSGGGAAWQVFKSLVDYLDGMMTRSVLASWLDLPAHASRGSFALSADQSAIFMQTMFATAQEIADTITCEIIAPLVRVNFGPEHPIPRFIFERIDEAQSNHIMTLVGTIMAAQNGPQIPQAMFHMLLAKVAQFLNLDDEQVQKILDEEPVIPTAGAPAPGAVGPDGQPLPPDPNAAVPGAPAPVAPAATDAAAGTPAPVDSAAAAGAPADGTPEALAAELEKAGIKL